MLKSQATVALELAQNTVQRTLLSQNRCKHKKTVKTEQQKRNPRIMATKYGDFNRWSTSLKSLMARLDDLNGVYEHKLCLTIATNHESPQIHLYGDKELVRSVVRSNLLEQMELSDDCSTVIQFPLTGDLAGDVDPNTTAKPSINKRRGVVDCLEIENFPSKFVFKKGAPPLWWPENVVFGSFHKGRNASEKGEVSADMGAVLSSYGDYSRRRADALENMEWDTALPMMKRLRLKEISYGEGKSAMSTIVKSRDEPEIATQSNLGGREEERENDEGNNEIGEELEERRGDEEVMGQEPRTAEEMVSIVGEGRAEGQENIAIDKIPDEGAWKGTEEGSGRIMRGNGRGGVRGQTRGGMRGSRGRGGGAGGMRSEMGEGMEMMQMRDGNGMMEEMDSQWNVMDVGGAMGRDGDRYEIQGGEGLRMEEHGMNGMDGGIGKKRGAMEEYGREEEGMRDMELTVDVDGMKRGRGGAATRGGGGRGGTVKRERGGMIAMTGGGYEMEGRGERGNGRMEGWNRMSDGGGIVRGGGMEMGMIGVGRPGQREETTYQRLVKRLDLEDPKPLMPRPPKVPTLSPDVNEITLNLTFVGYYNSMLTLTTNPDCTLSFNLHNLPSFPIIRGLKFRARFHNGKIISTSIPISAWATAAVHDKSQCSISEKINSPLRERARYLCLRGLSIRNFEKERVMSRRHSSTFNLTGTKRRATPSPTRSPSRLPSSRVPIRPPRPVAPPPLLVVADSGDGIVQIDILDQPDLPTREDRYGDDIRGNTNLVGCSTTIDTCHLALPDCDIDGKVLRGRKLRYVACRLQKIGDQSIAVCSCDQSRRNRIERIDPAVMIGSYEEYQREECLHLSIARSLPICTDFLSEIEHAVVIEESVQFSVDPCLFLVRDKWNSSGVIKITRMTLTCLTCHSQRCTHCMTIQSGHQENIQEIREEIEEEEESRPPLVMADPLPNCVHGSSMESRRAVMRIVDRDGVVRQESVHLQYSQCCKHLVHSLPLVPLSTSFALERRLLIHYEASFTQGAVSLTGYWNILREFRIRDEQDPDVILSLSSLKRGWTEYLSHLDVPSQQFLCPKCGLYPETLIFDATTIGTRGDLASYAAKRDTNKILNSHTPGWFGTREMRRQMRAFSNGEGPVKTWVPTEFTALIRDSIGSNDMFNIRYQPFYNMMFSDSPIPDILKVGSDGRARQLLTSIIDETVQYSEKETAEDMLRYMPILYIALCEIGFDSIPKSLFEVLRAALTLNDSILRSPIRRDSIYGPPIDTLLEYYPNWPLKRGRPIYQKDSRTDNMDCSQKLGHGHDKLSPGIMIATCHHRYTYGFSILTSCESPRHIFEMLITRMDGGDMPRNIIYDNSCHLSAYCLAREPGRFKCTRFFIDRFHEKNHRTCSPTMKMSAYSSDEALAKINTQSVEQTNATLRHIRNIIPFLSVDKYRKCLMNVHDPLRFADMGGALNVFSEAANTSIW
ncbi:hypothetical protein PRIPAC_81922, partial [Pristionchus pacificus]|uniref:Uncharacterized protein n=1 Tax=Pristionchus pacificus TaxID=54126 RepID=A0A2A6C304_PRIPA